MALLDTVTYRRISGDTSTYDYLVDAAIVVAQSVLEDYLQRPLELATRTETVRIHPDGRAYPAATPVASVSDPLNTVLRDATYVMGLWPQANPLWDIVYEPYRYGPGGQGGDFDRTLPIATITYIGGFTASTLPRKLRQALVDLTRVEVTDFSPLAASVTRATVGDTSVTYAEPPDRAGTVKAVLDEVSGYRRREIGY